MTGPVKLDVYPVQWRDEAGIASAEAEMREWRGALATLADIARSRAPEENT